MIHEDHKKKPENPIEVNSFCAIGLVTSVIALMSIMWKLYRVVSRSCAEPTKTFPFILIENDEEGYILNKMFNFDETKYLIKHLSRIYLGRGNRNSHVSGCKILSDCDGRCKKYQCRFLHVSILLVSHTWF